MLHRFRFAARAMAAAILVMLAGQAGAACDLPELRTDERPGAGGAPTIVSGDVGVLDFLDVDDLNQQIEVDLATVLRWTDPRLDGLEGCRFGVTEVWFPQILLANSSNLRRARTQARDQVEVGPGGQVTYRQRATGLVSSYHQLRDFPFDRQRFPVDFVVPEAPVDEIRLAAGEARISTRLNIEGWKIGGVTLTEETRPAPMVGRELSVMTLTIDASRAPTYYIFRIVLPLLFVVAMSWTIFWVPPSRFEFQIGLGATSMLTAIAFTLSISSKLPNLGYLTRLDKMLIWAVFLVFLSIVEALTAGLWVLRNHEARALRLDRISRIAFPLLLLGGWAYLAF